MPVATGSSRDRAQFETASDIVWGGFTTSFEHDLRGTRGTERRARIGNFTECLQDLPSSLPKTSPSESGPSLAEGTDLAQSIARLFASLIADLSPMIHTSISLRLLEALNPDHSLSERWVVSTSPLLEAARLFEHIAPTTPRRESESPTTALSVSRVLGRLAETASSASEVTAARAPRRMSFAQARKHSIQVLRSAEQRRARLAEYDAMKMDDYVESLE